MLQAVILAAGSGTRLEPITNGMSKAMIPVANKPLLEWIINSAPADEIILVVRKEQKDIIECFKDNKKIKFVYQNEPKGTADAIACCEPLIKDKFLVLYGDGYAPKDELKKIAEHDGYAMALYEAENTEQFGSVEAVNGFVKSISEKSGTGNTINAGIYLLGRNVFDFIRKTRLSERNEYEITDTFQMMIGNGTEIKAFMLIKWMAITYPWDILEMNKMILDAHGSQTGKAEIRSGSCIEEPVAIGDSAVIGPNCFIRKYSCIGKGCKVGNAVEIKNSIIMDNSFVSHLSYVGDSIVGRNCNIGAGAIFANLRLDDKTIGMNIRGKRIDSRRRKLGALVGDNAKLGVNVTIMPGKKIYPNILIPACYKVENDITEQIALK